MPTPIQLVLLFPYNALCLRSRCGGSELQLKAGPTLPRFAPSQGRQRPVEGLFRPPSQPPLLLHPLGRLPFLLLTPSSAPHDVLEVGELPAGAHHAHVVDLAQALEGLVPLGAAIRACNGRV